MNRINVSNPIAPVHPVWNLHLLEESAMIV
jgi:hypothetical protein